MLMTAIIALGVSILFLVVVANHKSEIHAQSLLKVEVRETHFFPMIYRDEASAVSNFLSAIGKQPRLGNTSRASEMSLALERVGQIRGTSLFHIDYSGTDSNAAQVAASNAAEFAISFYATNQPSWQVTLVETRCFKPLSVFARLEDSVWVCWRRCKEFLGL